jgi:hypothetical protein
MFELTQEGYKKAVEFLNSVKCFYKKDMDGYSVVHLANYHWEKLNKK